MKPKERTSRTMAAAPKKYVKVNGIMKLNPEFKKWREAQGGGPATTVARPSVALPIISSMDDHEKLNDAMIAQGQPEIPLAESTASTIEMMQEPEICVDAGMVSANSTVPMCTVPAKG